MQPEFRLPGVCEPVSGPLCGLGLLVPLEVRVLALPAPLDECPDDVWDFVDALPLCDPPLELLGADGAAAWL